MTTQNRMKINAENALHTTERANSDRRGWPAAKPVVQRPADTGGWDPFEVWRTRVKEARERSAAPNGDRPYRS